MWKLSSFFFLLVGFTSFGQYTWQWTELDTMPFRTANNAVCEAIVGGQDFVYSFGGIDVTKAYDGIHKRSFKYSVANNVWSEIAPLPDTEAKIASGASFVKDKIYILGGYHVYSNGNEISSDKVHIYNPATDTYETDGTPIPLAIDDHVQCVYKDSLIYVVTGWSNNGNKPNVQIYNPSLDEWQVGTSVPNDFYFTAFGASGHIIGDTLYYHGGASGGSFTARSFMRKGYIDPADPKNITWTQMQDSPGDAGYRGACSGIGNTVFWVGGSPTSYNYNGIAYNGSGGVDPSARILHFNSWNYQFADEINQPYGVMDLRGIAKLSGDRWIICGGMDTNQVVSNRTFLLENALVGQNKLTNASASIKYGLNTVELEFQDADETILMTLEGKRIKVFDRSKTCSLSYSDFPRGVYLLIHNNQNIKIRL